MSGRLPTYLHDHLAGARFAMDLLTRLSESFKDEPLGIFATRMLEEIKQDCDRLQELVDRLRGTEHSLKELAAWMAEKASRFKLRFGVDKELAVFEILEALSLGVLGKLKLWIVLATVAETDSRLRELDFEQLMARAHSQHDEIEIQRVKAARIAFGLT